MKKKFLLALIAALFIGCADKEAEYNKPAAYWYEKILNSISKYDVEKADDYYSSLQSEHVSSPLLPQATLVLAKAHMDEEEYILADYYLDEYLKRFAKRTEREFVEFMKVKAKYLSFKHPRRDQILIDKTITEALAFKKKYKNSYYLTILDTMLARLYLAREDLNKEISELYTRLDKPKGAEFYKKKIKQKWINWDEVKPADQIWFRKIFE